MRTVIAQYGGEALEVPPTNPKCKHGKNDCLRCGTKSGKDHTHTTKAGKGVVGRLRNKKNESGKK